MTSLIDGIDYGPLAPLIGRWVGEGMDLAPDAEAGPDYSPYTDELCFSVAGAAENAESQQLVALQYRHQVRRQSNGLIFHDQLGHWLYEPATGLLMHSLSIPRGVCVLAGGSVTVTGQETLFEVEAKAGSETFGIVQSPFMAEQARTKAFVMKLTLAGDSLSYKQTMSLHIYGKDFEHVDQSRLQRLRYDAD